MEKKNSLSRSALLFLSAFSGGALLWQLGVFVADHETYGGAGLPAAAAAFCAGAALAASWRREPATLHQRCAALLLVCLAWNFRDLIAVVPVRFWQPVNAFAALAAGGAVGFFLRGWRSNPAACLIGLCFYPLTLGGLTLAAVAQLLPRFLPLLLTGALGQNLAPNLLFLLTAGLLLIIGVQTGVPWPLTRARIARGVILAAVLAAALLRPSYLRLAAANDNAIPQVLHTIDGSRYFMPAEGGGGMFFRRSGEFITQSPCDLASRPALLPTLLQFQNHNLQVLVVAPPFSVWPIEAGRYPWVARIDHLSNDATLARLGAANAYSEASLHFLSTPYQLGGPYDLVAVSSGDPMRYTDLLTRNGILAVAAGVGDPAALEARFRYSMRTPGPGNLILYSDRPLESDLRRLDEQMRRSGMGSTPLPGGVLEVLYSLPHEESVLSHSRPCPEPGNAAVTAWSSQPDFRQVAARWYWWTAGIALFAIARFWRMLMTRRQVWQGIFADLDAGMGAAFGLATLELAFGQLGLPLYLSASIPALAFLMLLPRESLPNGVRTGGMLLIGVAPFAAAVCITPWPWAAFAAGVLALAALNLWRTGHTGQAPFAAGRVWLGAAIGFAVLLGSVVLGPGGFWFAAAAITLWRRLL